MEKVQVLHLPEGSPTADVLAALHEDYFIFVDAGVEFHQEALLECAVAIDHLHPDLLYGDEDKLGPGGEYVDPFYKPDWSPDLLYSSMYVGRFLVVKNRREFLEEGLEPLMQEGIFEGIALSLCHKTSYIHHVSKVLYAYPKEDSSDRLRNPAVSLAILNSHLERYHGGRPRAAAARELGVFDLRYPGYLEKEPLVSIIIPMKDKAELTKQCVESILEKTTYSNYEIIILDNRSEEEKTFAWFKAVSQKDHRVRVIMADFEFNWSKLNNFGIQNAGGDVYVLLNNDTLVLSEDWLNRLCENALRPEIGVVGPLLLYEDGRIQHAGVVVGLVNFADHIYKDTEVVHCETPYVSPVVARNVLALTGACMALSKATVDQIGPFNEDFIICGSDVEMCIRAFEHGLSNLYIPQARLYHLESKSRDSYIPAVDFELSAHHYKPYMKNVDPYFNPNLDITSVVPKIKSHEGNVMNFRKYKNYLLRNPLTRKMYHSARKIVSDAAFHPVIPEISQIKGRKSTVLGDQIRYNLLVPSVNRTDVFGGITTAVDFLKAMMKNTDSKCRIIVTDSKVNMGQSIHLDGFDCVSDSNKDCSQARQILSISDRASKTLEIGKNDIFIVSAWWNAYTILEAIQWQAEAYGVESHQLIYMIQDYEPGFYAWSSRYVLAESTYRSGLPVTAVFNSSYLMEYFHQNGYCFTKEYCFEPVLNASLKKYLLNPATRCLKRKQIIVYGRPSVVRNGLEIIVDSLKRWCKVQDNIEEWTILSVGENHPAVDLGGGIKLISIGKLTLEEYARLMMETYMSISLMVSPHPSYPPLEMSTFGIKTITNTFATKDLSSFNPNIISLSSYSPDKIAAKLHELADNFQATPELCTDNDYVHRTHHMEEICRDIHAGILEGLFNED